MLLKHNNATSSQWEHKISQTLTLSKGQMSRDSYQQVCAEGIGLSAVNRSLLHAEGVGLSAVNRNSLHAEGVGLSAVNRSLLHAEGVGLSAVNRSLLHAEGVGLSALTFGSFRPDNKQFKSPVTQRFSGPAYCGRPAC